MSAAKLTPWFPADVKPVRPGVYFATTHRRERYFRYWTGTAWLTGGNTLEVAEDERRWGVEIHDRVHWRGLTSDPKDAA